MKKIKKLLFSSLGIMSVVAVTAVSAVACSTGSNANINQDIANAITSQLNTLTVGKPISVSSNATLKNVTVQEMVEDAKKPTSTNASALLNLIQSFIGSNIQSVTVNGKSESVNQSNVQIASVDKWSGAPGIIEVSLSYNGSNATSGSFLITGFSQSTSNQNPGSQNQPNQSNPNTPNNPESEPKPQPKPTPPPNYNTVNLPQSITTNSPSNAFNSALVQFQTAYNNSNLAKLSPSSSLYQTLSNFSLSQWISQFMFNTTTQDANKNPDVLTLTMTQSITDAVSQYISQSLSNQGSVNLPSGVTSSDINVLMTLPYINPAEANSSSSVSPNLMVIASIKGHTNTIDLNGTKITLPSMFILNLTNLPKVSSSNISAISGLTNTIIGNVVGIFVKQYLGYLPLTNEASNSYLDWKYINPLNFTDNDNIGYNYYLSAIQKLPTYQQMQAYSTTMPYKQITVPSLPNGEKYVSYYGGIAISSDNGNQITPININNSTYTTYAYKHFNFPSLPEKFTYNKMPSMEDLFNSYNNIFLNNNNPYNLNDSGNGTFVQQGLSSFNESLKNYLYDFTSQNAFWNNLSYLRFYRLYTNSSIYNVQINPNSVSLSNTPTTTNTFNVPMDWTSNQISSLFLGNNNNDYKNQSFNPFSLSALAPQNNGFITANQHAPVLDLSNYINFDGKPQQKFGGSSLPPMPIINLNNGSPATSNDFNLLYMTSNKVYYVNDYGTNGQGKPFSFAINGNVISLPLINYFTINNYSSGVNNPLTNATQNYISDYTSFASLVQALEPTFVSFFKSNLNTSSATPLTFAQFYEFFTKNF